MVSLPRAACATPRLYWCLRRWPRRRVRDARRVDRPGGWLPPPLPEHQLGQRAPAHRAVAPLRAAQGDGRHDLDAVGDVQQRAKLGVRGELPIGHDAAVAEGAGGQQQVLAGGVDRRAVAVRRCGGSARSRPGRARAPTRRCRRSAAWCGPCAPWASRRRRPIPCRSRRPPAWPPRTGAPLRRSAAWPPGATGPSVRTTKRKGWRFEPLGARVAAKRMSRRASSGTGSSV